MISDSKNSESKLDEVMMVQLPDGKMVFDLECDPFSSLPFRDYNVQETVRQALPDMDQQLLQDFLKQMESIT